MGRQVDRELRRRRRRQKKLRRLKARLAQTKDPAERERLIDKIRRISYYPMKVTLRE